MNSTDTRHTRDTRIHQETWGLLTWLANGRADTAQHDRAEAHLADCADCKHYVGHGITGTEGMAVSVALRPEKISLDREAPADTAYNAVQGTIKEMSYFGSFTVYHLTLASGATLKISQANTERHRDDALTWGDPAWAQWSASAHVVLTS